MKKEVKKIMGKKEVWKFSDKKKKIDDVWYYTNVAFIDKKKAEDLANQGRAQIYSTIVLPLIRKRTGETWWAVYIPVAQNPHYRGMSVSQRMKNPYFTRKQSCWCCTICIILFIVINVLAAIGII